MQYIRSLFFIVFMLISIPVFTFLFILIFPVPYPQRSHFIANWSRFNLWMLSKICNLKYEVSGLENIPEQPCIIFSKHQSTWETMALQMFFRPQVWIIKRELTWVPFFGWSLIMMHSIAIDRRSGKKALKMIIEQGTRRLKEGNWVIIFPEGTRKRPDEPPDYKIGGAMLAKKSGYDVLPVAHNAGYYWPKGQFLKKSGIISFRIGPVISVSDKSTQEINDAAQEWIESNVVKPG